MKCYYYVAGQPGRSFHKRTLDPVIAWLSDSCIKRHMRARDSHRLRAHMLCCWQATPVLQAIALQAACPLRQAAASHAQLGHPHLAGTHPASPAQQG